MQAKLPNWLYRALRTFGQGFAGAAIVSFYSMFNSYITSHVLSLNTLWFVVIAPAIAAGISALMNLDDNE